MLRDSPPLSTQTHLGRVKMYSSYIDTLTRKPCSPKHMDLWHHVINTRALIIKIGFGRPIYYNYNKEPPKTLFFFLLLLLLLSLFLLFLIFIFIKAPILPTFGSRLEIKASKT